jgi:hypothetical protein
MNPAAELENEAGAVNGAKNNPGGGIGKSPEEDIAIAESMHVPSPY